MSNDLPYTILAKLTNLLLKLQGLCVRARKHQDIQSCFYCTPKLKLGLIQKHGVTLQYKQILLECTFNNRAVRMISAKPLTNISRIKSHTGQSLISLIVKLLSNASLGVYKTFRFLFFFFEGCGADDRFRLKLRVKVMFSLLT